MQYDNTNSGALFLSDKGDNPKRPDRRGTINIEGTEYWLSGWIREKNGKPYLSLKAERKESQSHYENSSSAKASQQSQIATQDDEDDIPF